jgi:uncharacterized protein YraI
MVTRGLACLAALAVIGATGPAEAETAVVRTAVNVRTGPGPEHRVVGVLSAGQRIEVVACTQSRRWCQVSTGNGPGWIYTSYITWSGGADVPTLRNPGAVAATPGATGAPVDQDAASTSTAPQSPPAAATPQSPAAVAAVPDDEAPRARTPAPAGSATVPPETVRSYVASRPDQSVYLEGQVVVGAGLPPVVPLYEVPGYDYRYAFVNDERVLVDANRRIVYVFR